MTKTIKFNARILAAVAVAMSTDGARLYLRGVHLHPDGKLEGTDGTIATVAKMEDDTARDIELSALTGKIMPITKKTFFALKKRDAEFATWDGEVFQVLNSLEDVLHMEPCKPIDSTFPDTSGIYPTGPFLGTSSTFSSIAMGRLVETAKILSDSRTDGAFRIGANDLTEGKSGEPNPGEESAHIVRYTTDLEVYSVIMPMRTVAAFEVPEWARPSNVCKIISDAIG